jgi:cell division protein YceG involved in septum cleavage
LSRGDRSRTERTTEQREREREERERRRAGRNPDAPAPATPSADEPLAVAPGEIEASEAPHEPEPFAFDAPQPDQLPASEPEPLVPPEPEPQQSEPDPYEPPPTEAFEVLPAAPEPVPVDPLEPAGPPPLEEPAALASSRRSRPTRRPGAGAPAGGGRRSPVARMAAPIALLVALIAVIIAVVTLSSGPAKKKVALPTVVNVLIPEGENRLQIAEIAKAKGLTGSYRRDSERSPLLDPRTYGAPKGTPDLEGFLFPATYELDKRAPALRLVEDQLAAFTEHFGPPQIEAAKALHVTPYQLLTIASMIEREAQVPGDRAKIAAVIYNRLAQGIPLGIDASIYYAVELEKNIATYTHELTEEQLHINSPYNTRTHAGLPPTPISNPGAASIEAAAHPAKVSYLYYVAGADGCGEQVFSETQAQFETNVAAYKAAVEKNRGHPPVCKKK